MVTQLLERAIEIEGLLRIIRDGNPLPETYGLLKQKVSELADGTLDLKYKGGSLEYMEESSEHKTPQVDIVMTTPDKASETTEVVFSATTEEKSIEDDLELSEEDDIILTFDEPEDRDQRTEARDQRTEARDQRIEARDQRPETSDQRPEAEELRREDRGQRPEDRDQRPETRDQRPETRDQRPETRDQRPETRDQRTEDRDLRPEARDKSQEDGDQSQEARGQRPEGGDQRQESRGRGTKLKSAFSLNDRYLYARELFGGNMKMFDSALDFIEGVDDQSVIEEYFFHELGWDPENNNVVAFMEILRNSGRTSKKMNS